MSRPSSMIAPRNLSLTEELERLEQSITLTLQEIDHNFSKAHRIVTGSILPVVEQYAKHSEAVWQGSMFWKQFFEASANVSLSGYEEGADDSATALDETVTSEDQRGEDQSTVVSGLTGTLEDDTLSPEPGQAAKDTPNFSSKNKAQITPKRRDVSNDDEGSSFEEYTSPYEVLRKEVERSRIDNDPQPAKAPTTPGRRVVETPGSRPSPFINTAQRHVFREAPNPDPLLHKVLDKTYRIQATPHTAQKTQPISAWAHMRGREPSTNPALDSSPFSPDPPAPQLRSEIFDSPVRSRAPLTPGVSVQADRFRAEDGQVPPSTQKSRLDREAIITWDSDEDDSALDNFGMSPPKTMQFHVPQSRLLQTPAREASKRIVEELLMTAGAASATSTMESMNLDRGRSAIQTESRNSWALNDDSPSVIRVQKSSDVDDSF